MGGPGQMDISIDACLFDHSSYTMHLHDQTCVGSGSMEDGSFELTTALDDCGTQLEFNVDFYTDSSYGTQSAASDVITVGEQVYFGVSAANLPSSVSFSIMDCTVTNTNGADLSYYIVENFCPDVYTRTDFSGDNMQKDSVFLHYQAS